MLGELLRPLLRYLFWSRRRFLTGLAVLLLLVGLAARVGGCSASSPSHPVTAPATQAAAVVSPAPTASRSPATQPSQPQVSETPTIESSPAPTQAIQAASAFLDAWVSRGPARDARIQACATAELAATVTGPGAGYAPATAITGPLVVTGHTGGTVSVTAPTNAGPALLTVRLSGGRWLAAQLILARAGD